MMIAKIASELAAALAPIRASGQKISFVPTMGALHDGHLSLVEMAKAQGDFVVVSIFVNPLQFGAGEDFDRYPRTIDEDAKKIEGLANLLFAPTVDVVYPTGQQNFTQHAGTAGETFEGAARPGHFDGMLTVVARLFDLVKPDSAIFGAKDAQQIFLVRQMAERLYPSLKIIAAPTVREVSGLALSSRNRFLPISARPAAEQLNVALHSVAAASRGGRRPSQAIAAGLAVLANQPEAKLEYLAIVDPNSFEAVDEDFTGEALVLIAATVAQTRLIDNVFTTFQEHSE
jgi:pantoate--beta-alanine ligase